MKSKFLEIIYCCLGWFFKTINFKKEKILIYSDSRGFDVIGTTGRNPFNSYLKGFIYNYNTEFFLRKEKHTSILDFLDEISNLKMNTYDYVILHCGVVDFSPRPLSNLNWVLNSKEGNKYFQLSKSTYKGHYEKPSNILYDNEETNNLYSKEFLVDIIIPKLKSIDNLIWINSNNFVKNWDGNFSKGRPKNIADFVSSYDDVLKDNLDYVVDLKKWNDFEIKKYTIDNIHFTKDGFKEVYRMINEMIVKINSSK